MTMQGRESGNQRMQNCFLKRIFKQQLYLSFSIQAVDAGTGELIDQIYYVINPVEEKKEMGESNYSSKNYIDTEVMNPLIAGQFSLSIDSYDYSEGFEETNIYKGPLLDILNVRTAFERGARTCSDDLYICYGICTGLYHFYTSMQENGLKVCLAIMGGGTGLGFANLTDAQISDFTARVQTAVSLYDLDGINLWDKRSRLQ